MATPVFDNYALIPHPHGNYVLMLKQEDTWTLPRFPVDETRAINRALAELLGLTVTVLYCADEEVIDHAGEKITQQVYAFDNHSRDWQLPSSARWVSYEDLSDLELAVPAHRNILSTWFQEMWLGACPEQRRPWARIGWYATATAWLQEQLTKLDYHTAGPIEQFYTTDWSCILRAPTQKGDLYLKCCDPGFPHEPILTQTMSQLWPDSVPRVLAIDSEHHWMLMEDVGKPLDEDQEKVHDIARWKDILTTYVRIQIEAIAHRDRLLESGCPDRRLVKLPALFTAALSDQDMLHVGEEEGLSEAELARAQALTPRLRAMCEELASYGIPETLHHDDLHAGNIVARGDHYVFFDWAESFIAHPFYSLVVIQRYANYIFGDGFTQMAQLRGYYLSAWTAYVPLERLHEAFQLAQSL